MQNKHGESTLKKKDGKWGQRWLESKGRKIGQAAADAETSDVQPPKKKRKVTKGPKIVFINANGLKNFN